ncbi:MAG: outer membrane protein [Alphaproteobacteria bacterium]
MKKTSIYITASAVVLIASSAQAGQHYVAGALSHNSMSAPDVELASGGQSTKVKGVKQNGKGLSIAYGYDFDSSLRLESGLSVFEATEGFSDTLVTSMTASAFYDLDTGGKVTPYVGAGLGLAVVGEMEDTNKRWDVAPTVQFMAGANFEISKHVDLFSGLKYQHVGSTDFGEFTNGALEGVSVGLSDFGVKTFEIGARYTF